jgi:hypothetical protein
VDQAELRMGDEVFRQRFGKLFQTVLVLHQGFGFGQQHFACAGKLHTVAGAGEKRRTDVAFYGLDLGGNGRLRQKQPFGGLRQILRMRHSDKGAQLIDIHIFFFFLQIEGSVLSVLPMFICAFV